MLLIIRNGFNSPDSTYFNTRDAQPELEHSEGEQVLKLVNGTGTRRSTWGEPGVTSNVILETEHLVSIHVGFFHKHGGGQFWRHYRFDGTLWQQVRWARLTDEERLLVLDGYTDRAQSWAEVPGKLRTEYRRPMLQTQTTYKLVEVVGDRYFSVFDRKTEYVFGKRLAEKALDEHSGGYYSYPTDDGIEGRFLGHILFPEECYERPMTLALIECEISGTMITYGHKIASTYLRPIEELKRIQYTPALQEVC